MARNQFVSPARLVLIGRDEGGGGGEAAVRNAIRRHGLEKDVLLTGEVTDKQLQAWFARADVFALFSRYEAFGLVFFEAMAWGVPVLTHRVGTNTELLQRGAILTNAYDSAEATEKLVRLVNDENFRLRIGRDAKKYAGTFTWDSVIEKFITLYRSVILERRSKTTSGVAR
jgi:glycosyltransferase involved in cell wall biosynthesis